MKLPYLPALNGVRTLAIGLVIFFHWPYKLLSLKFGWIGVNIFFLLSGFLITRILANAEKNHLKEYLLNFYRNRALRIFPLYFGYISLVFVILFIIATFFSQQVPDQFVIKDFRLVKPEFIYLATFLYNFAELFHFLNGEKNNQLYQFFGHFWSLCVEEQYYLVFPVVVFFLSKKSLKVVFLAIIVLTPFLRVLNGEMCRSLPCENIIGSLLTKLSIFHLDAFAIGGLLSLVSFKIIANPLKWLIVYGLLCVGLGLSFVLVLNQAKIFIGWDSLGFDHPLFQYSQQTKYWFMNIRYAFTFTLVNIGAGLLLLAALNENRLSNILSNAFFSFVGQISFGLYVFHLPLNSILIHYFTSSDLQLYRFGELFLFTIYIVVAGLFAWLSYVYYESFFLRKKIQIPVV